MIYGLFFFKIKFSGFIAKNYLILAKITHAAALLLALITFFWILKDMFNYAACCTISTIKLVGVIRPILLRYQLLRLFWINLIVSSVTRLKSEPLGRNRRISPLVFSFSPRSQEQYG